jgi:predicted nucleic acid-binding protein
VNWYFLDACSLLNLYATMRLERIASALGVQFSVLPVVYPNESQFIYARKGLSRLEPMALDLSAPLKAGLVRIERDLSDAENVLYLEFAAAGIDDGEAITAAAAILRGGGLVTDDRKARRVITENAPQMEIIGSIGLVRRWVETQNIDLVEAREVLLNLEICGNYTIGKREPELVWCQKIFKPEKE